MEQSDYRQCRPLASRLACGDQPCTATQPLDECSPPHSLVPGYDGMVRTQMDRWKGASAQGHQQRLINPATSASSLDPGHTRRSPPIAKVPRDMRLGRLLPNSDAVFVD